MNGLGSICFSRPCWRSVAIIIIIITSMQLFVEETNCSLRFLSMNCACILTYSIVHSVFSLLKKFTFCCVGGVCIECVMLIDLWGKRTYHFRLPCVRTTITHLLGNQQQGVRAGQKETIVCFRAIFICFYQRTYQIELFSIFHCMPKLECFYG